MPSSLRPITCGPSIHQALHRLSTHPGAYEAPVGRESNVGRSWPHKCGLRVQAFCIFLPPCVVIALFSLLAVEARLFDRATWDGYLATLRPVEDDDIAWWKDNLGVLPPPIGSLAAIPPVLPARDGNRDHPDGGRGTDGESAIQLNRIKVFEREGVVSQAIEAQGSHIFWGRALGGSDGRYAFRLGVTIPFVLVERVFECDQVGGATATHLTYPSGPGWEKRPRWMPLLLGSVLLGAALALPLAVAYVAMLRLIRKLVRRWRGGCAHCGYDLSGQQGQIQRCPECGTACARSCDPATVE